MSEGKTSRISDHTRATLVKLKAELDVLLLRWPDSIYEIRIAAALACAIVDEDQMFRGGLTLAESEREFILAALKDVNGDKARAARRLGISRRALYRKLEIHDLGGMIRRRRRHEQDWGTVGVLRGSGPEGPGGSGEEPDAEVFDGQPGGSDLAEKQLPFSPGGGPGVRLVPSSDDEGWDR